MHKETNTQAFLEGEYMKFRQFNLEAVFCSKSDTFEKDQ